MRRKKLDLSDLEIGEVKRFDYSRKELSRLMAARRRLADRDIFCRVQANEDRTEITVTRVATIDEAFTGRIHSHQESRRYPWDDLAMGESFTVPFSYETLSSLRSLATRQYNVHGNRFEVVPDWQNMEITVTLVNDWLARFPWRETEIGGVFFVAYMETTKHRLNSCLRRLRNEGIEYEVHPDRNRWALKRVR